MGLLPAGLGWFACQVGLWWALTDLPALACVRNAVGRLPPPLCGAGMFLWVGALSATRVVVFLPITEQERRRWEVRLWPVALLLTPLAVGFARGSYPGLVVMAFLLGIWVLPRLVVFVRNMREEV